MSINLNPSSRVGGEMAAQHANNQPRIAAFDASKSSLVSMQPQQGLGDIASGTWSVITWPFRTLGDLCSKAWNWCFGPSTPAQTPDQVAEFGKVVKDSSFNKDAFKAAYAKLSDEERNTYKTLIWVASGHYNLTHGADAAAKKIEEANESDRDCFIRAFEMMQAKPKLQEFAQKLKAIENDKNLVNCDTIKRECYDSLPAVIKTYINDAGYIFGFGRLSHLDGFDSGKDRFYANRRALETLAENNFILVPDVDARRELEVMERALTSTATATDVKTQYNLLGEKAKTILADIIGNVVGHRGHGANYLNGIEPLENGDLMIPTADMVRGVIAEMRAFDRLHWIPNR